MKWKQMLKDYCGACYERLFSSLIMSVVMVPIIIISRSTDWSGNYLIPIFARYLSLSIVLLYLIVFIIDIIIIFILEMKSLYNKYKD